MSKGRIIVGMSGGVDSSVAAALLKEQGFDVIGVTLQLYSYEESLEEVDEDKRHCHPLAFIHAAQQVAKRLEIPHHVINKEELFRSHIIEPFLQAYLQGQTPLPCARCNRDVKTEVLYQLLPQFGAQALATGHYVRRIEVDENIQLHRGHDPKRDQSFFLFALPPRHLDVLHFPLGRFSKEETRAQARRLNLPVADTPSSQDLCFISKGSYKTLFEARPGDIYHEDGRLLGTHQGVEKYTLGQRQGLGLGGVQDPLYVIALEASSNRVIVGPRSSLARAQIQLHEVNWLAHDFQNETDDEKTHSLSVKIRSSGTALPASVTLKQGLKEAVVTFQEPDYGVAPGQACVFYQGTRLVGGGWIL